MQNPEITAVILAGGQARRMGGVDKGWMELNGKPLIRHVQDIISPQVPRVLINANRSLDAYSTLSCPVIADLDAGYQGPLMGIATGLQHATDPWVLFVPCDSPYLPRNLAERMLEQAEKEGADIAVAHDGVRLQSVVALIKRDLLESVKADLAAGGRKVERWYAKHRVTQVDFSDHPEAFTNVNHRDDLAGLQKMPKLLGFAAWSGTGKTTLLKQLIPRLKSRGVRLGVIKHAHHKFDIDHPGKDSYELRKAGADQMLISSGQRWALMVEQDQGDQPSLNHLLNRMDHELLDLVLVEGFRHNAIPKIELHRASLGKPLLCENDENIIAIAADTVIELPRDLPQFDLNQPESLVEFIIQYKNS